MSDIENSQVYQPQRYPGDIAPVMPETVRIVPATVKEAYKEDYTVDLMLNCPTPTNSTNFGILFRKCLVLSFGGQIQVGSTPWGVLALPCKDSLGYALFIPGAYKPVFLGGSLFPSETWHNALTSGLLAKMVDVKDWVIVHPSGVEVKIANTKEVTISQPTGASLVLKANGSVEVTAKAAQTITESAGGATVGAARLNDTVMSDATTDNIFLGLPVPGVSGWVALVTTFINALAPGSLPLPTSITGKVTSASSVVKVE